MQVAVGFSIYLSVSALLSLVGPGHCFYHLLLGKTERRLPAFKCDVF